MSKPLTLIHVTHEAVEQVGGIGTVLEGLVTSPLYQRSVGRTILIGPLPYAQRRVGDPVERLGESGVSCRYSGLDEYDPEGLGAKLGPIEWAFGVRLVYGTRGYHHTSDDRHGEAEVLLIDVRYPDQDRLNAFKASLFTHFGLDCHRYEREWDFEEYCRLADPAYHALVALLGDGEYPAVVFSHEFMGMCTALRAAMDQQRRFRTVFHAHECATARRLVESLPGHDAAFYPAMRAAIEKGQYVEDVFGDQSFVMRHALVERAHHLDATLAVGDETASEMKFLSPSMAKSPVHLAYNGVPSLKVDLGEKKRSRELVDRWLENVIGYRPDYLFTHVTRPVISKGLWRDLKVCAHMERRLADEGVRAVYLLLTCGAQPRSPADVRRMAEYGWPGEHRAGYPDLAGPEEGLCRDMRIFNDPERPGAGPIRAILVNQFGFDRDRLGEAAPEEVTLTDLRWAADVEFGQSCYEPFGIAQYEPLHAGAICVPGSVCGCWGLAVRAMEDLGLARADATALLAADYTQAEPDDDPVSMTQSRRDEIEERVAEEIAVELLRRLPRSDADRVRLMEQGHLLADRMSWDRAWEQDIEPVLMRIMAT